MLFFIFMHKGKKDRIIFASYNWADQQLFFISLYAPYNETINILIRLLSALSISQTILVSSGEKILNR